MSMGGKKDVPNIPTEATSIQDPITVYYGRTGRYPSNAEIWWMYRRPIELGTDEPPKQYIEVFDPGLRHQMQQGNSQAPKGHYILSAFHQDRQGASGLSGSFPVETSNGFRPTSVAFYAGRVFYAGVNTAGFNTKIYFSQILERAEQVQMCYQQSDPTDEDIRDLLPTDGGVIVIPEVAEVYHMQVMGLALFIFCRNGVWMVAGSEGVGFRANDYAVTKISSVPAISNMSFVSVEGAPMWWNRTGIHTLVADQGGTPRVQSLTETTIQKFFDDIPVESKFYAKGTYDPLSHRVQWLYRKTSAETEDEQYNYDTLLNLDVQTGAFYPYSISEHERINTKGLFSIEGFATFQELEAVHVDDDPVLVSTDEVILLETHRTPVQSKIKYIIDVLPESDLPPTPPDA